MEGDPLSIDAVAEHCWAREHADRVALLVNGAPYFKTLRKAMLKARRSIIIVGWDIRSDLVLDPDDDGTPLDAFLFRLLEDNPRLEIRLLIWDWLIFYVDRQLLPQWRFGGHERLRFVLDSEHPPAACHHEKFVVIDGKLAFCGGLDLSKGRFDTAKHPPTDPRRSPIKGDNLPPFHDMMLMFDGAAARRLEELAIERWHRTGHDDLAPAEVESDPWPEERAPWLEDVEIGIARTRPGYDHQAEAREIEAVYRHAIDHAERIVFIENQYLTVDSIAEGLAARLEARPELEIVIITPAQCEGPMETAVMDLGRLRFLKALERSGCGERVRVMHPLVGDEDEPVPVNVHAKIMIVDDRLFTVGSANLAYRSMGLDTETNVVLAGEELEPALRGLRYRLVAEHLGTEARVVEAAVKENGGSLIAAIESLNEGSHRLEVLSLHVSDLVSELARPARLADPSEPLTQQKLIDHLAPPPRQRRMLKEAVRFGLPIAVMLLLALAIRLDWLGESHTVEALLLRAHASDWSLAAALGTMAAFVAGSFLLLPVTAMILATAALFGIAKGFVYAALGTIAATSATFLAGRLLGHRSGFLHLSRNWLPIANRLRRNGMGAVITLRLVPLAPFTLVNVIAGASRLSWRSFMLGTMAGMVPGMILMVLLGDRIGAAIRAPQPVTLATLAVATLALVLFGLGVHLWWRRRARRPVAA